MQQPEAWDRDRFDELLERGDLDEAEVMVDAALAEAPDSLPASIARARHLLASNRPDEAARWTQTVLDKFAGSPWFAQNHLRALLEAGMTEEAETFFLERALPEFAETPHTDWMFKRILAAKPSPNDRLRITRAAAEKVPSPKVAVLLARQYYLVGDMEEAAESLRKAAELGPLPREAQQLRADLNVREARYDEALVLLEPAYASDPDPETARRLIRAELATGRMEDASRHLLETLARHPGDWLLLRSWLRASCSPAADAEILSMLKAHYARADPPLLWRLMYAFGAIQMGELSLALAELARIREEHPSPLTASVEGALKQLHMDATAPPPRIGWERRKDLQVVRHAEARATIVMFAGLFSGHGHLPFPLIDPILARLPANVVYLRDPRSLAYLRGIPSLGPDEEPSVSALRDLVAGLGQENVITVGGSIGGYAAARYGLRIGARQCFSFSGPTTLRPVGKRSRLDPPAAAGIELDLRELRSLANGDGELTDQIAASPDFQLTIIIGENSHRDRENAAVSAHLPNVTVTMLPDLDSHFSANKCVETGDFESLLRNAIG